MPLFLLLRFEEHLKHGVTVHLKCLKMVQLTQIHFIPVKVSIVRATDTFVQPEGPPRSNFSL